MLGAARVGAGRVIGLLVLGASADTQVFKSSLKTVPGAHLLQTGDPLSQVTK